VKDNLQLLMVLTHIQRQEIKMADRNSEPDRGDVLGGSDPEGLEMSPARPADPNAAIVGERTGREL
jgi:hypothetical protein